MKLVVLALACLVAFASAQINCKELGVVVDDFSIFQHAPSGFDKLELLAGAGSPQTTSTNPVTGASGSFIYTTETFPAAGNGAPDHILGGYRDEILYIDTSTSPPPGQGTRFNIFRGPNDVGQISPQVSYSTDAQIRGYGVIEWDGNSDASSPEQFVKNGLGGIDMTAGGASAPSFALNLLDTDLPLIIRIEAWSYTADPSQSVGVFLEWTPSLHAVHTINFVSFTGIAGTVDPLTVFRNVGAMRMIITNQPGTPPEIDLTIYSLSVPFRFCLLKAIASGTASSVDDAFNLFTGASASIITTANCNTQAVHINDTLTFLVQAYVENVGAGNFSIVDDLSANFQYVPGSTVIYTNGAPTANITGTLVSEANNHIEVRFDVFQTTTTYVSVFFQVKVSASAVSLDTCVGTVPNIAHLITSGVDLSSVWFNGQTAVNGSAQVCIIGAPALTFTEQITYTEQDAAQPGDTFTLLSTFQNTGEIAVGQLFMNVTFPAGGFMFSDMTGWTCTGSSCVRNLGTLQVGPAQTLSEQVVVPDNLANGAYTIIACIYNVGPSLPGFCEKSICVPITVQVKARGVPNVKICKSGYMIRQIEYFIDILNPSTATAHGVVLQDVVPYGTTFNAAQSDARWNCTNGFCYIAYGDFASAHAETVVITVDVPNDNVPCLVYNNTAHVIAANDNVPQDNYATAIVMEPGCPAEGSCIDHLGNVIVGALEISQIISQED